MTDMAASLQPEKPLGLYVHWPFCKAKCPYCDFNSHVSSAVDFDGFESGLLGEMAHLANRLPTTPPLHSIFFGGGTPSLMPPKIVAAVIAKAEEIFSFAPDIEITAEANPTSVEAANLAGFRDAGINRISLGVQAMNDDDLRFLGREHSTNEAMAAMHIARRIFDRVSMDLIYGLPNQSKAAWRQTLDDVLRLELDHLSLYQLTIEAGTVFHTRHQKGDILTGNDDAVAALFEMTNQMTAAAGMSAYEVSNYAKSGAECRHNLIYWRAQNWIGIGPGAHSRFDDVGGRTALATRRSPAGWLAATKSSGHAIENDTIEKKTDWAFERLMMGLRLTEGVSLCQIEVDCGPRGDWLNAEMMRHHIDAGLLTNTDMHGADRLATTQKGRLFLNRILGDILL